MFVANASADARRLISALFFTWFAAAGIWTVNALRRPVPPGRRFPPLWLPGMIVSELAPWYLVGRSLVAGAFIAAGALERGIGQAGLGLFILSQIGAVVLIARTMRSAQSTGHSPSTLTLFKVAEDRPDGVDKHEEIHYWDDFTLDVYARPGLTDAPTLVYVHPGSWMRGRPGRNARVLFHRLAARGWVIFDIRYPLSPAATFPEHLVGVKRALAWARNGGGEYGADPGRVFIAGASSGAHLAALAALTANRSELQPGFETDDTSVLGCVPSYGIYDLLVRNPTRYDWPFIARYVMKAFAAEAPDLYALGSPIDQVHPDAPPFLVIHGEFDSIVLAAESQHFVAALRESGVDATYFEVGGAQHGFDAIASLRSRAVANMCVDWLDARLSPGP